MTPLDNLEGPDASVYPRDRRVDALVAAVAQFDPDALAVAGSDARLTYGELLERADAVAEHLIALGVGTEELVGLCLPRSAALVVGALGILRAGAVYVALDPTWRVERLELMLADCGARVLIAAPGASASDTLTTVELAADAPASYCAGEGVGLPRPMAQVDMKSDGSSLAYVVYTSGSTGLPKGVLIEHAGLLNLITWHRRAFSLTRADRGTQVASPGFDALAWEIWPYLATGASVHIPPAEVRADPPALRDWLIAEEITVSFLPTALAEQVSALDWPSAPALRYVLTGGDRLRRAPQSGLPFKLVNNYGVSEATVVSTSGLVRSGVAGPPTIGRAIDGVRLVAVDSEQTEVAPGITGELLVGGASVARGYLRRPELTKERFVSRPLAGADERWYRTGDLVRQLPDGDIEFLGRVDDQVQVRGARIELGEVSARLDAHPEIRASVVTAIGDEANDRRLYAYLVPYDDLRRPRRRELQDYLARYLPEHMVPAGFTWIPELPQTPNGKVDRAALPPPMFDEVAARPPEEEGPRSELEDAVASVVAELLGRATVGLEDNFFLLGGHSLLGAQLIARVGDQFGVSLGLRTLFDNPTVAGLAAEVESLIIAQTEALTEQQASQLLDELSGRF